MSSNVFYFNNRVLNEGEEKAIEREKTFFANPFSSGAEREKLSMWQLFHFLRLKSFHRPCWCLFSLLCRWTFFNSRSSWNRCSLNEEGWKGFRREKGGKWWKRPLTVSRTFTSNNQDLKKRTEQKSISDDDAFFAWWHNDLKCNVGRWYQPPSALFEFFLTAQDFHAL